MFCSEEFMQTQNNQFRAINKPTDILSWKYDNTKTYGELLICLSIVEKQAAINGWGTVVEALRLFAHGVAHLQGYDHELGENEEALMLRYEIRLLNSAGLGFCYEQ